MRSLQMDFLEHSGVDDVVIMSVVLQEAKARNISAYNRLRALTSAPNRRFYVFSNENHQCVALVCAASGLCDSELARESLASDAALLCSETYIKQDPGETVNDRNDRAIRVAAAWCALWKAHDHSRERI